MLALVAALGLAAPLAPRVARSATLDVRLTGVPPLLQALEAVSNCTGLAVDDRRFRRAASLYSLLPDDLTPYGRFPALVADLQATYRRQILDDRLAFCSAARLRYAVKDGILIDLDRDPPTGR